MLYPPTPKQSAPRTKGKEQKQVQEGTRYAHREMNTRKLPTCQLQVTPKKNPKFWEKWNLFSFSIVVMTERITGDAAKLFHPVMRTAAWNLEPCTRLIRLHDRRIWPKLRFSSANFTRCLLCAILFTPCSTISIRDGCCGSAKEPYCSPLNKQKRAGREQHDQRLFCIRC
jgi:hypothetical protein